MEFGVAEFPGVQECLPLSLFGCMSWYEAVNSLTLQSLLDTGVVCELCAGR